MGIPHNSKYAIACTEAQIGAYYHPEMGCTEQFLLWLLTGEFHVPTGSALTKLTRADTAGSLSLPRRCETLSAL